MCIKLPRMTKKEKFDFHYDLTKFIITFLVGTVLAIIITNQVVHPMFSPRLSEYTSEPLYIQMKGDDGYRLVVELSYTIEVPLFPFKNSIIIRLPNKEDPFANSDDIEISELNGKDNPYVRIPLFESTEQIDKTLKSIELIIDSNGFEIKEVTQEIYLEEKLNSRITEGVIGWQSRYWYNDLALEPIIECNVLNSREDTIGYAKWKDKFYELRKKDFLNNCDLDVRGLQNILYDVDSFACDEQNSLEYGNNKYIKFDIDAREEKRILIVKEIGSVPEHIKQSSIIEIQRTEHEDCFNFWNAYKKLNLED
jgi:hypothetical protein